MGYPKISVLITVFNHENYLKSSIESILSQDYKNFEIVVVDDGSTDKTKLLTQKSSCKLISNPTNIGYGMSIKIGINNSKYDTIIICDADGTYPIEKTKDLFNEYLKGYDLVIGQRVGKFYYENFFKSFLRILLKFIVEFVSGQKIPDINSGFRVFSKKTTKLYYNNLCDTFSFTSSQTLTYIMTSKFIKYLPIIYKKRIGKSKVKLFSDSLKSIQYIFKQAIYYNPLKIFFFLFFLFFVVALVFLIIGILFQIKISFLLSAGFLIFSSLMIAFGILAELLKQILSNNKMT